jgi:hypothetical protein
MATTPFATCSCGATYSEDQVQRLDRCLACQEPFFEAAAPVNVPAIKEAAFYALEQSNGGVALELLRTRVPQVLDVVDELVDAVTALMGPCRCAERPIIGGKPHRRTPCPHVVGARALRAVGKAVPGIPQRT